ncbi:hypothetical protein [Streptomyces acidicola]|uniref:hypothetical protein n=1 Tax=Streptomyces acidicola TaxID=2596892 RepID=UPI00380C50FC
MSIATKRAAVVCSGDVIGYEGAWHTVKEAKTDIGPMGGLAVVVTWEEGGTARFPAGDEVILGEPDSDNSTH